MESKKLESMDLHQGELSEKVALITGAGRGIGKELAKALAWLGANVIIAEISESGAEVEGLIRSEGGRAVYIKTDLSDENDVKKLAEEVSEEFGGVDILVSNAAVVKTGPILKASLEDWEESWKVNVRAAILLVKAFLPGMISRKDGVIVMMTSQEGMPYAAPYSASKAALSSFALSLSAELDEESGVSVFSFAPGMVDTPGIRKAARELAPFYGMSYEEFMGQSINLGYDGLMPAEDCATGLAYCIVHAEDYHGQTADPFQPLASAGLLGFSENSSKHNLHKDSESKTAIELARELEKILKDVEKETNELNGFARMWVRKIFKQRTGMSTKEWLNAIEGLISELGELEAAIEPSDSQELHTKLPWIIMHLEKLADNFRQNMKDIEAFIKDPDALNKAQEVLAYRESTTRSLIGTLSRKLDEVGK